MELFTVNRYTEDFKENTETSEDAILQKILQKAEKRKRKQKEAAAAAAKQEEKTKENNDIKRTKKDDKVEQEIAKQVATNIAATDLVSNDDDAANTEDFQILGQDAAQAKLQKVEMVLPSWLAHPTIIATSLPKVDKESETNLNDLPDAVTNLTYLDKRIIEALKEMQITRLFPVQTTVVPWILEANRKPQPFRPRDICVSAPTGSGKTLAFALPVVQLLLETREECVIGALIVLPVAELALQVFKVFKQLCAKTGLNVCLLSKQTPFEVEQEKLVEFYKEKYYSKVDIVVTTPGRLVEHLHATKGFCLKSLRYLVIDEADRIMDAVFQNWLYHFDAHVRHTSDQLLSGRTAPLCLKELEQSYKQPHKLLFSATLSQDPEKLQNLRLFQPKLFTSVHFNAAELAAKLTETEHAQTTNSGQFIGKYTTPVELSEKYCLTESRVKPLTLFALIKENNWQKFLIFTNSADSAERLALVLQKLFDNSPIEVENLSANLTAGIRNARLRQFEVGKLNGLIASDALARGIDVSDVDIVVSYDLPRHIKTYIHRVGRTARAGRPGTAITLLTANELEAFNKMLSEAGKIVTEEINVSNDAEVTHAGAYSSALDALRRYLEDKKNAETVAKKRLKGKIIVDKNSSELTLMEKLQVQADDKINEKDKAKQEAEDGQSHFNVKQKRTKFNANKGKTKNIH